MPSVRRPLPRLSRPETRSLWRSECHGRYLSRPRPQTDTPRAHTDPVLCYSMERSGSRPLAPRTDRTPRPTSADGSRLTTTTLRMSPPFRWPGGKRWLVDRLLELVPADGGRYFEPFFGGGALFWALRPQIATISDSNLALWRLRGYPGPSSRSLCATSRADTGSSHVLPPAIRETNRRDIPSSPRHLSHDPCIQRIHRVNKAGDFNVPYSGRTYARLRDESFLSAYADALQSAEILSVDFEEAVASAAAGDVIYLDPPYTVKHGNNGFVKYNDRIFSWGDQKRLARVVRNLASRGCHVIVSNADHDSIRELYDGFIESIETRTSAMAAETKHRGDTQEIVLTNVG